MHIASQLVVVTCSIVAIAAALQARADDGATDAPKEAKVLTFAPLKEFIDTYQKYTSLKRAKLEKELLYKTFKDQVVVEDVNEYLKGIRITSSVKGGTFYFDVNNKALAAKAAELDKSDRVEITSQLVILSIQEASLTRSASVHAHFNVVGLEVLPPEKAEK